MVPSAVKDTMVEVGDKGIELRRKLLLQSSDESRNNTEDI
jgi:hypothetical protein